MSYEAADVDLQSIEALTAIDPEVRDLLKEARIAIESVYLSLEDKEDVADSLRRFATELSWPARHPERLMRYWNRIMDLAPTVGHLLATSEEIQQLSMWWGDSIRPKGGFLNEAKARDYVESIEDPSIRAVMAWAYSRMAELSFFERTRPEGAFDLLYFYKLFDAPYIELKSPAPREPLLFFSG